MQLKKLNCFREVNWFKIIGFGNIIAHNYFGIDVEEVWQIIGDTFIGLESKLKIIINK